MRGLGKSALVVIAAFLLPPLFASPREEPVKIRLSIKYNDQSVPTPSHVTFGSAGHTASAEVQDGKFDIPPEIFRAKTWCLVAVIEESQIELCGLSQSEFAYENWTLYLADRRYKDHAYAVPKGTKIRSSCMLVLESERIDPGQVIVQTHCRSAAPNPKT